MAVVEYYEQVEVQDLSMAPLEKPLHGRPPGRRGQRAEAVVTAAVVTAAVVLAKVVTVAAVTDVKAGVIFVSAVEPVKFSRSFCFSAIAPSMVSAAPVNDSSEVGSSTFSASSPGLTVRASPALRMLMIRARRGAASTCPAGAVILTASKGHSSPA